MAKIKISSIKNENVKKIFRLPMSSRSLRFLESLTLTNDDIIETVNLIDEEYHKDKRVFFQNLVKSQYTKVKFNRDTFRALVNNLFEKNRLLELIRSSEGLTNEDKLEFVGYAMTTSIEYYLEYFVSGKSKEVDISIDNPDIAYEIISRTLYKFVNNVNDNAIDKFIELFPSVYNNNRDKLMTRLNQSEWKWKIIIIQKWIDMPAEAIEYFVDNFKKPEIRSNAAKHKNAPAELKQEYYEKTGDEIYLSDTVKDIFLF